MNGNTTTIIFDLGGVLIDWNPRYVYRQIFDAEEKSIGSLKISVLMTGTKNRMRAGLWKKQRRNL